MILIADSGSTKTDWRLVDGQKVMQFNSIGLNPDFVESKDVLNSVSKIFQEIEASSVADIFFYGSGCSSTQRNGVIEKGLSQFFTKAKVNIYHDLLGTARAACGKEKGIAGILGTGSNCCLFDGKKVVKEFRSGGFVIGDEGGGVDIGKRIIKAFIEERFDEDLKLRFDKRYQTNVDEILSNLYKKPHPNKYLANFSRFAFHNKENPIISNMLEATFQAYFTNQVLRYEESKTVPLNLVGSIAFYYQEIIRSLAAKNNVQMGNILEKPISGLTLYHADLG